MSAHSGTLLAEENSMVIVIVPRCHCSNHHCLGLFVVQLFYSTRRPPRRWNGKHSLEEKESRGEEYVSRIYELPLNILKFTTGDFRLADLADRTYWVRSLPACLHARQRSTWLLHAQTIFMRYDTHIRNTLHNHCEIRLSPACGLIN